MSGPASKLFPPGFFPDNSLDSKHSPLKMSMESNNNNTTINQHGADQHQ